MKKKTPTCFKPERFCVAKEYRGKGLGGQLLEAAENGRFQKVVRLVM